MRQVAGLGAQGEELMSRRRSCRGTHVQQLTCQGGVEEFTSRNSCQETHSQGFVPSHSCHGLPVKGLMSRSSSQGTKVAHFTENVRDIPHGKHDSAPFSFPMTPRRSAMTRMTTPVMPTAHQMTEQSPPPTRCRPSGDATYPPPIKSGRGTYLNRKNKPKNNIKIYRQ